jgi:hypothetical protein
MARRGTFEFRLGTVGPLEMKAAADRGGLNEVDADSVGRTPFNVAIPLYGFGPDEKCEIVRNADRALDFERRART